MSRRRHAFRASAAVALLAFLATLTACPGRRAPLPETGRGDPEALLSTVRMREERIRSLRAQFIARARTATGERSADGVLLVRKPDAFRLRLYLAFGLTIFDYVSVGDQVQLALPLEGRITAGPAPGDFAVFSQEDLGQAFLRGARAFPGSCRPEGGADGAVWVRCAGADGMMTRRLRIDTGTATIAEEVSYRDGATRLIMRFDDQRAVDDSVLPYRIVLEQPQRDVEVTIVVRRYEVNPPLGAELFVPTVPWGEAGA